jgi:hypothetical protein
MMEHEQYSVERSRRHVPTAALGLVILGAAGAAVAAARSTSVARKRRTRADTCEALAAYLREHLSGAEVAIQVVDRLRRTHAGTEDGRLFAALFEEFEQDHGVVRELLDDLGMSSRSLKRLAGIASGSLVGMTAGGEPGDLSLFRTLEALAVGVQGKRCMWRALHCLGSGAPGQRRRNFVELESKAVRQWEAIEERRRALATRTFPRLGVSSMDS